MLRGARVLDNFATATEPSAAPPIELGGPGVLVRLSAHLLARSLATGTGAAVSRSGAARARSCRRISNSLRLPRPKFSSGSRIGRRRKNVRLGGYHAKWPPESSVSRYSLIFVTTWRRARIAVEAWCEKRGLRPAAIQPHEARAVPQRSHLFGVDEIGLRRLQFAHGDVSTPIRSRAAKTAAPVTLDTIVARREERACRQESR
jgi:hypothetical protein